jgi:propionyl-CoA carboxylase alpha chain
VEWQLAVADGEALPAAPPVSTGHSIEARLYAEDPARGWQPQAGRIHHFDVPGAVSHFGPLTNTGIRLDSGIADGSVVSIYYDPMLAKVIALAPTRARAAHVLADALSRTRLHGLRTNRDLLVNVLRHPAFLAGDTDTAFFEIHGLNNLAAALADDGAVGLSAVAAALADAAANRTGARVLGSAPSGWRNVVSGDQVKSYLDADGAEHRVSYRFTRSGLHLPEHPGVELVSATPSEIVLSHAGVAAAFTVTRYGDAVYVDSPLGPVALTALPRFPEADSAVARGALVAPMPGAVIRLGANLGDAVTSGQPLVWLEAMKMEHTITAPVDGVLVELDVSVGQHVEVGAVLARVDSPEPNNPEAQGREGEEQ